MISCARNDNFLNGSTRIHSRPNPARPTSGPTMRRLPPDPISLLAALPGLTLFPLRLKIKVSEKITIPDTNTILSTVLLDRASL